MAHLVWLKRDLRIDDHEALATAAARGTCVVLYVYEPDYYAMPEFDPSHHTFIDASLAELERALAARGARPGTKSAMGEMVAAGWRASSQPHAA